MRQELESLGFRPFESGALIAPRGIDRKGLEARIEEAKRSVARWDRVIWSLPRS